MIVGAYAAVTNTHTAAECAVYVVVHIKHEIVQGKSVAVAGEAGDVAKVEVMQNMSS